MLVDLVVSVIVVIVADADIVFIVTFFVIND